MTIERDARLAMIRNRDVRADGQFWYSVETTGVYCRPSCPSRMAKPAHIHLHDSLSDARATGRRPCLRCNPEQPSRHEKNQQLVALACQFIEECEEEPQLQAIADAVGRSPRHIHLLFKKFLGLSPREYALAHKVRRARSGLSGDDSITSVIYDAGFGSAGRFYEVASSIFGMTPSAYRKGGAREIIYFALGECSLGTVLVAASKKGIVNILLGDDPEKLLAELQDNFQNAHLIGADRAYEDMVAMVVAMVEDPSTAHNLPLDVRGTAFQQRVWRALMDIPAGQRMTYDDLARKIGNTTVRKVTEACAANRIAVAVPCHRVVRQNGSLTGYGWGIERRRKLLAREEAGE